MIPYGLYSNIMKISRHLGSPQAGETATKSREGDTAVKPRRVSGKAAESRLSKLAQDNDVKGVEQARQQLPTILAAALAGRTTFITRHGRQVAAVVPAASVKQLSPVSLLTIAGSGAGLWGPQSSKTIQKLRDEWNF